MPNKKESAKKTETKKSKFNVVHKGTKAVILGFDSEEAAEKYIGDSNMLTIEKA